MCRSVPHPRCGGGVFTILDINGGSLSINNAGSIATNPGNLGIGPNVTSVLQKATITGNVTVDPTDTYSPRASTLP